MEPKVVFISHSTQDKQIALFLKDFLLDIGVNRESIFCSSIAENGAVQKIPDEIKAALKTSVIDIVILSPEYLKSDYCLNEAGIIWYKDGTLRIIVSTVDEAFRLSAGFLDKNYLQLDLNNNTFIYQFIEIVEQAMHQTSHCTYHAIEELRSNCSAQLPIIKNIHSLNSDELSNLAISKKNIDDLMKQYVDTFSNPLKFYRKYRRNVLIDAAETPGNILVRTTADLTIVNLSNSEHVEVFSSQFVKKSGGRDTLKLTHVIQDGIEYVKEHELETGKNQETFHGHSVYAYDYPTKRTVPPHSVSNIIMETIYEIPISMFFQSKVVTMPCAEYELTANFGENFKKKFGDGYIFRFQIIPPDPKRQDARLVQQADVDKTVVHVKFPDGMRAGGGYVLAISKIPQSGST